jgi:hypothetical protein
VRGLPLTFSHGSVHGQGRWCAMCTRADAAAHSGSGTSCSRSDFGSPNSRDRKHPARPGHLDHDLNKVATDTPALYLPRPRPLDTDALLLKHLSKLPS